MLLQVFERVTQSQSNSPVNVYNFIQMFHRSQSVVTFDRSLATLYSNIYTFDCFREDGEAGDKVRQPLHGDGDQGSEAVQ